MKVKSKSKEKKSKRIEEEKLSLAVFSPERKLQRKRSLGSDETIQLNRDVKSINKKMERDGEVMFFERLPQKILELTEYMKTQPFLKLPFSEIQQNLSVDKYVLAYQAERKEEELKRFVLATHVSFEDWRKKQKHLSLAEDVPSKDHEKETHSSSKSDSMKSPKKEKSKQPIPFPQECTIPINPHLVDILEFMKKEVRECVILCSSIKMWITLKIPRMEDGNDFGVAIQEECVDTISEIEEEAYNILDMISTYHSTRGNYIVQMAANPSIMDYASCISQVDETQFFNIKLSLQSLRNDYALLYDLVTKNLEKLQAPAPH
ncbi:hypothetical protein WA171_000648, partial [Blastocystis sp. BT1]